MPIPPNDENYTVGKGILSIGAWVGSTPPTIFVDVGNAINIEVEHALERLPHYSSRAEFKRKDKNPVIQTDYSVTFSLDEMAVDNLKMFLGATEETGTLHALQASDTEYALQFVSDNPLGPNRTWTFWKASLTPSGPLSLIGDTYMQMDYMAEGLADVANHPASSYYDVTYTTTTTTSSTTSSTSSTISTTSTFSTISTTSSSTV